MRFQYVYTGPVKPWQKILFGLIFIVIGIIVLMNSISNIKTYNQKNETYIETTSVVVDYAYEEKDDYYDEDRLVAIIVEYTVDGQTYRKQSSTYSNITKAIGTKVQIKYNPDNPRDAIWVSDSTNIVLPLIGGILTLAGILIFISGVRKKDE